MENSLPYWQKNPEAKGLVSIDICAKQYFQSKLTS